MASYKMPDGLAVIPDHLLDLRPDDCLDQDLLHPSAVTSEKNVWFFWHAGYAQMPPYHQRTVRAYQRRLSRLGWAIRVVDIAGGPLPSSSSSPPSPTHISRFVAVDAANFPAAFRQGTLSGDYARQHYSDLVRWPLLLRHGGVYADVGLVQIGDLDRLWRETVGNPASPYAVLSYGRTLSNYFLAARSGNALFARCHRLFLALWAADGGHTTTAGMHASPLLRGLPLMGSDDMTMTDADGRVHDSDEVRRLLTDYIIQGQVMARVLGLVDDADGWDGPAYARQHVYALDFLTGSQLINALTDWDGPRQFALLSQRLPAEGVTESADQRRAREIVEQCLRRSFGFKLATGLILRVMGDTLSSLWRRHEGSDVAPGTYAAWFRYGTVHWIQRGVPEPLTWGGADQGVGDGRARA